MATTRIGSALLAGALALAACGSDGDGDEQGATPGDSGTVSASTTGQADQPEDEGESVTGTEGATGTILVGQVERSYPGTTYPPELTAIITLAVDDLAASLGVDAATINVVGVDEVTWPNGGLGCPEPGMSYTQAVTDGLRILLESGGESYDYRSGGLSDPRHCQPTAAPAKETTTTLTLETDGTTTTVTSSTGQSASIVTRDSGDDKEPTEGNNPPDE